MNISKDDAVILGLYPSDLLILKALAMQEMVIADIATTTEIPRTSLYYMLPRLEERGFVKKIKQEKKIYWKKAEDKDIYATHINVLRRFNKSEDTCLTKKVSPASDITFHYGNENALNVFKEIADMPAKSRFYGIQPEQSIIGAVERNPIEDILAFNRKINAKKLIVEGIIHEKGTDSMVKTLSKDDCRRLLKSFANRSADTVKLPDNFLSQTKAEIYLYEDKIAIVNWYEEFAVIIRNKDVFELVKEMFNSTKYLLERYDQNEKIARRLIDFEGK